MNLIRQGGRQSFTTISIPKNVIERIKVHIEQLPHLGYGSYAEFVKRAIEEKIEKDVIKEQRARGLGGYEDDFWGVNRL